MSARAVLVVEAHSGVGGPPATLLEVVTELAVRCRVVVAIPPGKIEQALRERAPDATVVQLPPWTKTRRWRVHLRSHVVIRRALRLAGPDAVVHANGKSALNLVAPALLGRRERPLFVHFHDFELTPRAASQLRGWQRLGVRARFSPVSDVGSGVLRDAGLESSLLPVLPNPVRTSGPVPARQGPGSPFRLAWAGSRELHRKGLDLALETVAATRDPGIRLDVFGLAPDSPYLDDYKQLATSLGVEGQVTWMGRQSDFARRLPDYDAALITSRRESFCRVAIEAMAAGLPVVAARIPGLDEAVGDGNCLFFELGDVEGAADAILALQEPRKWLAQRERGFGRADEFTPARVCDDLEQRYAALERPAGVDPHLPISHEQGQGS